MGEREIRQGEREANTSMYYQAGHAKSPSNCILGQSIRGNWRNLSVESPIGQKFITQGVNFLLQLAAAQESPEYLMGQCQQGRKLQSKRWEMQSMKWGALRFYKHGIGQSLQWWLGWNKGPKVPEMGEAKSFWCGPCMTQWPSDLTISSTSL